MYFFEAIKRYLKSEWYNFKNYHKIKLITWRILNNQSEYKKVLINLYIPNELRTSEIDSILINKYGI